MAYRLPISFAVVVLLSLNLVADGSRLNSEDLSRYLKAAKEESSSPEGEDEESDAPTKQLDGAACATAIAEMLVPVMERYMAFQAPPCNVEDDMINQDSFEVTEAGHEAICKDKCLNNPELATDLLGLEEIFASCTDHPAFESISGPANMVRAMDAERATCTASELGDTPTPEDEPVVPTRGKIAQLRLDIDFRNAFSMTNKGECELLKTVFKKFDYRRTGKITMKDYDKVLNELDIYQKKESKQVLEEQYQVFEEEGSVSFAALFNKKLDFQQAAKCGDEYVKMRSAKK